MKPEDRIGQTVGIYTIIGVDRGDGYTKYVCKCNYCGRIAHTALSHIRNTTKCTHLNKNGTQKDYYNTKWNNKNLKNIFNGMMQRCYRKSTANYPWYGGKGIRVCDEWINNPRLFEQWSLDNGYYEGLSIDRIDSNKDYCPENCRWITLSENHKYNSNTKIIEINGEAHSEIDWAKILGLTTFTISKYIKKYGLDDTIEFMRRYKDNPELSSKRKSNEPLFDLYMS